MECMMNTILQNLMLACPTACAIVKGSEEYCKIAGYVNFYSVPGGTIVAAEVTGLPRKKKFCDSEIFGFHIHEGGQCLGEEGEPFKLTGSHYNTNECGHPAHRGDMPVLFGNNGFAWMLFLTNRFMPQDIIGRTVVIHSLPDDFHTQPSGNSGEKIACGEIVANTYFH